MFTGQEAPGQNASRRVLTGRREKQLRCHFRWCLTRRLQLVSQVNRYKADLPKVQEFYSIPIDGLAAVFMLSLRRFVSHRNVYLLRTRRPVPAIRRRQHVALPHVPEKEGPALCRTRKEWGHADWLLSERCKTGIDQARWFGCPKSRSRRSRRGRGLLRIRDSCRCQRCLQAFSGKSSG